MLAVKRVWGVGVLLLMSSVGGACGGSSSSTTDASPTSIGSAPATGAAPSTVTTRASAPRSTPSTTPDPAVFGPVPAGTTLRVGDQFGLFQGVLGLAGMDGDVPYDLEHSTLTPGPTQIQAFQAGHIDVGVLSPLQLMQAASAGVELRAVSRWRTDFALNALVTAPGVDGIVGWESLRGKRVALQRNTLAEALAMLELDRVGMTLDDVTIVDVPVLSLPTVLQRGDADAGVLGEPSVSAYLADNPDATYVLGIEEPLAHSTLVVASSAALADTAKAAAIAEYLGRLDAAFARLTSDKESFADLVVGVWGLDRAYVDRVLADASGVRMDAVPGDLTSAFDRLGLLLVERGDLGEPLELAALVDLRYADLFGG